jgi:mannose-1-phosphate guanylyltransferase
MKAILLSAGYGTRLKPITNTIPKCLVEIDGKPLLSIWLDILIKAGITEILINTHYLENVVLDFINHSKYKNFVHIVYEEKLLGTGGTLLKNKNWLQEEPVILIHADNLSIFNIIDFINSHIKRNKICEITMMTFVTDNPSSCGIVEIENNIVIKFYEKIDNPPSNHANGAIYIIEPTVISFLESMKKDIIDFSTEVIPNYLGKINIFQNKTYHRDIGNIDSYNKANIEYKQFKTSSI